MGMVTRGLPDGYGVDGFQDTSLPLPHLPSSLLSTPDPDRDIVFETWTRTEWTCAP